jgi:acetyltransferase-like isoleucine patch superfamily enzyme
MNADRTLPWDWYPGRVPDNVAVDAEAYIETTYSFELFRSAMPEAVRIGRGSSIYLGVMFDLGVNARVSIGEFTLMNGSRIISDAEIAIGNCCLISWNTVVMDSRRLPLDRMGRRRALEAFSRDRRPIADAGGSAKPVRIGDNVWIGFDSCILPGVTIGEGAVVGARSVVTTDVPPFTVVAGNPARTIRQINAEDRKSLRQVISKETQN